jgi:hypothetical protein
MTGLRFESLAEAARALAPLRDATSVEVSRGTWSAARALHHCAVSIECSVRGFPSVKPWLVRAIARRLVLARFMRRGYMRHDVDAAVPGVDEPDPGPAIAPAVDHLLAAIAELQGAQTVAPHAIFGAMSAAEYDRYHAMHIAEHASTFVVDGRPFAP